MMLGSAVYAVFQCGIFVPVSAGFYDIVSDHSCQISQYCTAGRKSRVLWSGRTVLCSAAYFFYRGQLWPEQIYVLGTVSAHSEPCGKKKEAAQDGFDPFFAV